jgi:hypothetical protein
MNVFRRVSVSTTIVSCLLGIGAGPATAQSTTVTPAPRQAAYTMYGSRRLVGEQTDLRIARGVLSGRLRGGAYQVEIDGDRAVGTAPLGRVDVRLVPLQGGYDVRGIWNGQPIRLLLADRTVRGSAMRQAASGSIGFANCHYDIALAATGGAYSGTQQCMGALPVRVEVNATPSLTEASNVILLVAYLTGPMAVVGP